MSTLLTGVREGESEKVNVVLIKLDAGSIHQEQGGVGDGSDGSSPRLLLILSESSDTLPDSSAGSKLLHDVNPLADSGPRVTHTGQRS